MNLLDQLEKTLTKTSNSRKNLIISGLREGVPERIKEVILHIGCNPHGGYFDMDRYFEKRADHGDNCFDIWISQEEKEMAKNSNTLWYLEVIDEVGIVPIMGRYYASSLSAVVTHFITVSENE